MKIKFPEPLVLLLVCLIISSVLTYLVPAGTYDRVENEKAGREVVVPGSYHKVESQPVGFFETFIALPKGMTEAADVIFLVFLVGGAFVVVDKTGVLQGGVDFLIKQLKGNGSMILTAVCLIFGTLGALQNMQEEIIPLLPVLLVLTKRLGYSNMTAVSISIGAAIVGASFSPINPFQVGIAQKIAELPLLSGSGFRMIALAIALAIYITIVLRHATKNRQLKREDLEDSNFVFTTNLKIVMLLILGTFILFIYGVMRLKWGFFEMSALFFLMGILVGLLGNLGVKGTSNAFVEGFKSMTYAAMIIGFARAIFVVLHEGLIIDSIVYGLFTPLTTLPKWLSVSGITIVQSLLHFPVPSVSGQAVLTIPILNPLSDLLGISRQIIVLSFQYGAGLCEMITPTNGALVAIISSAGIRYEDWFKFAFKTYLILLSFGLLSIYLAMAFQLI